MPKHDTTHEAVTAAPLPAPVFDYDTPPPGYVPGTVVPQNTAPEDMTDAEYIQWMYDNLTPFWAIKKNMLMRTPPVLTQLVPDSAELGSPSFELFVHGNGFVNGESVIVFAGQDEPTMWHSAHMVSTGVNMEVWHGPDTVEVSVRNGAHTSAPLPFEFVADEIAARKVDRDHDDDDHGKKAKKKK
jgi:hypothetical protein